MFDDWQRNKMGLKRKLTAVVAIKRVIKLFAESLTQYRRNTTNRIKII